MASLAFVVALIFLTVIFSGPVCYILSRFNWIPNFIIYILSILIILLGVWFIMLPIPAIKYTGFVPIYLGYLSIRNRNNATIRDNNN